MIINRKETYNVCGIYGIINIINNKIYIGRSYNIYKRLVHHRSTLKSKSKDENRHLINSWYKYGADNFKTVVIEVLDRDEDLLKNRELYWMNYYTSLDRRCGYNLRSDNSDESNIVSDETKKLMSKSQLESYKNNPSRATKIGNRSKIFWRDNPNVKLIMSDNVSKAKQKMNCFYQYDKNMNLIKIWNSVEDILQQNPSWKWQNIYAVCNGYKPTIYGFIWRKIKK